MILYYIILFIPLAAQLLLPATKQNKIIIGFITMLFFCFGYMTGSDWRSYEFFYEEPINTRISLAYFEPGYIAINELFRILKIDFWHWYLFLKCITYIIWLHFLNKIYPSNFFLVLFFFLGCYGAAVFIDNPFRNVLAISIFLLSFPLIQDRKLWKFILVMLIALSIHRSILLIIPFYFLGRLNISTKMMIITFSICILLSFLNIDFVKNIIILIGERIPLITGRVEAYFINESDYSSGNPYTVGNLIRVILFFLIINKRKKYEERFGKTFFNFLFFSFLIYELTLSISILGRLNLYFVLFYCIGTIYLLKIVKNESKIIIFGAIFILSVYSMYSTITSSYKYIPYSNYLFNNKELGYEFRSRYNFLYSPYLNEYENK